MMSVEGEVVPLKKRIKPSEAGGAVEKWLVQVRQTLQSLCAAHHYLRAFVLFKQGKVT